MCIAHTSLDWDLELPPKGLVQPTVPATEDMRKDCDHVRNF